MRKMRLGKGKKAVLAVCFLLFFAMIAYDGTTVRAAGGLSEKTLTMTPATQKKLSISGAASKIKWSSSNKNVATVDAAGMVTARKKGNAKIKAVYKGKKYTCKTKVVYGTYTTSDGITYKDIKESFGASGRWFQKSLNGGTYAFTGTDGSAIYFKVAGSKYVDVSFVSNAAVATPYFSYSIDGGNVKRQKISKGRISLGNTKTHYVRLVIDSMSESENRWGAEAGVGISGIKAADANGVIAGVLPQNATIAFYGDSITQGVRAMSMALAPSGTSATHSYAWYCAQQLDLIPYFAGFGGSGIVQPGSFNNCINTIERFSAVRKADNFAADVIVVEHGTNDVYTYGDAYVSEYKKVLQLLHKKHPDAYIMAMIPFTQIHADEIRKAAAQCKSFCTVIETASWQLSYTDGLHPNKAGAAKAGKNLAKKIASIRKVSLVDGD